MNVPAAERGSLTITDRALTHLAEHALREKAGEWAGPAGRARARFGRGRRAVRTRIDLPYPHPAAAASAEIAGHLTGRLEALADTRVHRVAVTLAYTDPEAHGAEPHDEAGRPAVVTPALSSTVTKPRPRTRRGPAGIASLAVAAASALALTAVIQRRYHAHGRIESWARAIVDARPSTTIVTAGAAVLALAGLTAIILALVPGRRHLAIDGPDPLVHATVTPAALTDYLRHHTRDLDPATAVKIRRTRTVRIRTSVPPDQTDSARARLNELAANAPGDLAAPRLRVCPSVRIRKERKEQVR